MTTSFLSKDYYAPVVILIVALVVIEIVCFVNQPDRRTPSEKMGDAAQSFSDGVSDAVKNLGNRTPADKIRDKVKEFNNKAEDSKD